MEKVDSMQEQMNNVRRDMETTEKSREMLEVKITAMEINSAFNGLISSLDTTEKRICEFDNRPGENSQTQMRGVKRINKITKKNTKKTCGKITKDRTYG